MRGKFRFLFAGLFAGAFLLLISKPLCFATIIHVPGNQPTIQAGIDSSIDGDTVLVTDGRYFERITFDGKGIVVASEYILDGDASHIGNTIIDGDTLVLGVADTGSVVRFVNGEDSTSVLKGLTLQHGIGTWETRPYQQRIGGGIYCNRFDGSPKVDHCIISENSNGGIYENGSSFSAHLSITWCTIENNAGGGILGWAYGPPIQGCIIRGNLGVGLFLDWDAPPPKPKYSPKDGDGRTIVDCKIEANAGRGIELAWMVQYTIRRCEIRSNLGGGIVLRSDCSIDMSESRIINNSANRGGGVYFWQMCATGGNVISHCLFANNYAVSGGAVAVNSFYRVLISNCSFVGNVANTGAAVSFSPWYDRDSLSINNSLFAFNGQGEPIACTGLNLPTLTCSDIYGNEGGDWVGCIADQAGINGNFSLDPQFCDTASGDFHLLDVSPCAPVNNSCDTLIGALGVGCFYCIADADSDGFGDPGHPENRCPDDNCPTISNADQLDSDADGVGDVCDNCPTAANPDQLDSDADSIGNACDNCALIANRGQEDGDRDGIGNVCDVCPNDSLNDADQDGVCGDVDNCLIAYNPGQEDNDGDGIGNACDPCDCTYRFDLNRDQIINPLDVVVIVNFVYKDIDARQPLATTCLSSNGDWNCNGWINPVDVVDYVNFVYKGSTIGPCNPCAP